MHVYLREEPVVLEMRPVDPEGMVPDGSDLVAVAFWANGNERPSFRALLPPETLAVLEEATAEPVQLGVLAEEPESPDGEIQAMVGLSIPVADAPGETAVGKRNAEPWSTGDPDAWKAGEEEDEAADLPHAAILAFAPLIRLARKHPSDFGEELADLLETALAGATRPSLEARVDRMLGDL